MKIYTKQGDAGMSVLFDGRRVPKHHLRLDSYGTIDELSSQLGLCIASCAHDALRRQLAGLQETLFVLGADLATPLGSPNEARMRRISAADVVALEQQIDAADAQLPSLKRFILPGGGETSSRLHLARTICRRAERHISMLMEISRKDPAEWPGDQPLIFVNRLSDLLFVLARWANKLDGVAEVEWQG